MFEIIICIAVLFFISVLFYKQANEQFEILQLEAERMEDLPTLYDDRSPIVVSDFTPPNLGTPTELQKRAHILQMQVAPHKTLGTVLFTPQVTTFPFTPTTAAFLAKEAGLDVWFEHHLYRSLLPNRYTHWLFSHETFLWPHHRGLFQTSAFQTLLMPTQGEVRVSLLLPKMIPYLPKAWKGRQFQSLTTADTPLLAQIQFLEIVLRRGNLLLLPSHMIADVRSSGDEVAWIFQANVHHPISRLSSLS